MKSPPRYNSGRLFFYVRPEDPAGKIVDERCTSHGYENHSGFCQFLCSHCTRRINCPSTELQTILGRKPQSVKDYLKAAYQLPRWLTGILYHGVNAIKGRRGGVLLYLRIAVTYSIVYEQLPTILR